MGTVTSHYEHGNQFCFQKLAAEFLYKLTYYQLLKKESTPWSKFVDVYVNIYRNKHGLL
jgi:hypothetical protein